MNRAEKRAAERQQKRAVREIRDYLGKKQDKTLNDGRVEAMFLLFMEAMLKVLNLEPEECLPVLQYIEDKMPAWRSGEETLETIRQRLVDEYGFMVELGGASDGR